MKKTVWIILTLLLLCALSFSACDSANNCQHLFGEWTTVKNATCYEEGTRARICSACSEVEEESIPKTEDHTPVTDAAVPATYSKTGLTEGSHCSACGKILVEQTVIPLKPYPTPSNEEDFIFEAYEDGYALVAYLGTDKNVVVPQTHKGKPVLKLTFPAFEANHTLKSITLPSSIKVIGRAAFSNCTRLESIHLPESVTTIEERAFDNCPSLKEVTMENKVESIEKMAFSRCEQLKSIQLSTSLKTIGDDAFRDCLALEAIEIPDSVTSLGTCVFYRCPSLRSAVIGAGLQELPDYTFNECKSLKCLVLGPSISKIGLDIFRYSDNLVPIYYCGTMNEFQSIEIKDRFFSEHSECILYFAETPPEQSKYRYWHYVDNVPTEW